VGRARARQPSPQPPPPLPQSEAEMYADLDVLLSATPGLSEAESVAFLARCAHPAHGPRMPLLCAASNPV
jgi:hypothetical protein